MQVICSALSSGRGSIDALRHSSYVKWAGLWAVEVVPSPAIHLICIFRMIVAMRTSECFIFGSRKQKLILKDIYLRFYS